MPGGACFASVSGREFFVQILAYCATIRTFWDLFYDKLPGSLHSNRFLRIEKLKKNWLPKGFYLKRPEISLKNETLNFKKIFHCCDWLKGGKWPRNNLGHIIILDADFTNDSFFSENFPLFVKFWENVFNKNIYNNKYFML